jgi:hypothetical protein
MTETQILMKTKSLTLDQEPSMAKSHSKVVTGLLLVGALFGTVTGAWGHGGQKGQGSFLDALEDMPALSVSTVPVTGSQTNDQNPYGVTIVPFDSSVLKQGDILVSDFNNFSNLQGTGSSIVRIDPSTETQSLFFDAGSPVGLTTALVALRSGFVVVGAAPRIFDVTPPTVDNGFLIFLDGNGNVVLTLSDSALLNGPWDMTVNEKDPSRPRLFVSDVLSGIVVRIVAHVDKGAISIESITKIGSGFAFRTDPAALVIGPTGLAWDSDTDELFVADTGSNRIARLDDVSTATCDQGRGSTIFAGPPLAGPLGLLLAQSHLIAANGDSVSNNTPNLAVEITTHGKLVATKTLDTNGPPGGLFGITLTEFQNKLSLVFVNDNDNTVKILKTQQQPQHGQDTDDEDRPKKH